MMRTTTWLFNNFIVSFIGLVYKNVKGFTEGKKR